VQTEQNADDAWLSHEAILEMFDAMRRQDDALRRERERRRELEGQLAEMWRMMEEMRRRLDRVTVCHCEEGEEEGSEVMLDFIDVDNLLEGFDVGEDDEHFDPTNTFRERDQELDQGNSRRDQTE